MMKTTFSQILFEERRSDLDYKTKVTKNEIVGVSVELEGAESGALSRLAARFDRLEKAITVMAKKRDEIKNSLRESVANLFSAEDVVLTKVVETASFTMTLAKQAKGEQKTVVDYEKIAGELAKLIPDELQAKVAEITAMYTEVSIAAAKEPALRVKAKVDESLNEDIMSLIKSITSKVVAFAKKITSWSKSFDKKLAKLKTMAKLLVKEETEELAESMSPSTLRSTVLKAMKELGFSSKEQETTPGALKAWLTPKNKMPWTESGLKDLSDHLAKKIPGLKVRFSKKKYDFQNDLIIGDDFTLEPQGRGTLFLSVPRQGQAGEDYRAGKDT